MARSTVRTASPGERRKRGKERKKVNECEKVRMYSKENKEEKGNNHKTDLAGGSHIKWYTFTREPLYHFINWEQLMQYNSTVLYILGYALQQVINNASSSLTRSY